MFDEQYEQWLAGQRKTRKGEGLRRLNEGHGQSEKLFAQEIWWPVLGNFEFLHAEYEVANFRDGSYYLDYAIVRSPHKVNWEVDDFSSHAKNMDRRGFDYERDRQNQLVLDGWKVFRFPLDKIKERPRQCQQFLLQVMGCLYGGNVGDTPLLSLKQREIMRLAIRLQRPFTPMDACIQLGIQGQHARKLLQELVEMEMLVPNSGKVRIRTYSLGPKAKKWI
jgi:very-short-patch-repair endonuclease